MSNVNYRKITLKLYRRKERKKRFKKKWLIYAKKWKKPKKDNENRN